MTGTPPKGPSHAPPAAKPANPPVPPMDAAAFLALRRELRALSAKKRMDRIIERRDAMRVVRTMPVHDLYATIREVGIEDSLELLELASPRQVQAFLDLDGWRGDRLDGSAMAQWLRALVAANPDRAVGQIRGIDIELLTLLFKLHARVYDLSAEEQPEEEVGLHSITSDQRFLIAYGGVGNDEQMNAVLKDIVDRLLGRDALFILRLCESVRWELPSSLEEESFRWRNARLADLGFLPRHEAIEVLAWRDPDAPLEQRIARPEPAQHDVDSPSTDLSTSVVFPWDAFESGAAAFAQAARGVDELTRERVTHEVMLTANRLHCAEGNDAGDPEAVRGTARQVIDTVGVALSYRAQGDVSQLSPLLATTPVLTLFRIGHSLMLKLQTELRARLKARDSGLDGDGLLRLDPPLREVAAGLLRPRPLLFSGLVDKKRLDYRPPASLAELAALTRAVSEIGFRGALVGPRGLGLTDAGLAAAGFTDVAEQPSHAAVLGLFLARALVHVNDVRLVPLAEGHLPGVRDRLKDEGARMAAVDEVLARLRGFAPLPGAATADDVEQRARPFVQQVMAAMAHELGDVSDAPEGKYLATVWARA